MVTVHDIWNKHPLVFFWVIQKIGKYIGLHMWRLVCLGDLNYTLYIASPCLAFSTHLWAVNYTSHPLSTLLHHVSLWQSASYRSFNFHKWLVKFCCGSQLLCLYIFLKLGFKQISVFGFLVVSVWSFLVAGCSDRRCFSPTISMPIYISKIM